MEGFDFHHCSSEGLLSRVSGNLIMTQLFYEFKFLVSLRLETAIISIITLVVLRIIVILLMDKILHDLKDSKLWELWYIPYNG